MTERDLTRYLESARDYGARRLPPRGSDARAIVDALLDIGALRLSLDGRTVRPA